MESGQSVADCPDLYEDVLNIIFGPTHQSDNCTPFLFTLL